MSTETGQRMKLEVVNSRIIKELRNMIAIDDYDNKRYGIKQSDEKTIGIIYAMPLFNLTNHYRNWEKIKWLSSIRKREPKLFAHWNRITRVVK